MKTRVLAFIGPIGVGKTTLAEHIQQQLEPHYPGLHISFAEPIKKALLVMAGLPITNWREDFQVLKNQEFLNTGRTWRYAAQTLGTEWGRDIIHVDLWSKAACVRIRRYACAVVDDMRFHSEDRVLRSEFDVLTIHLYRAGVGETNTQHLSEEEYKTMPNVHHHFFVPETTNPGYVEFVTRMIQYLRTGVKP